jgi:hypothetical protein
VAAYEARIEAYNKKVASYNETGGAPAEIFAELQSEEKALKKVAAALTERANELQSVVEKLNALGERGNRLIDQYNSGVDVYNSRFGEPNEFTQGDYQGDHINIYSFSSEDELLKVLIHEFGHALGIGHVEGNESFMYYLLEDQPDTPILSEADLAAFSHVCGEKDGLSGWLQKTTTALRDILTMLQQT